MSFAVDAKCAVPVLCALVVRMDLTVWQLVTVMEENVDQLKNCEVGVDLSVDGDGEALLDIVYDDDVD